MHINVSNCEVIPNLKELTLEHASTTILGISVIIFFKNTCILVILCMFFPNELHIGKHLLVISEWFTATAWNFATFFKSSYSPEHNILEL